MAPRKAGRLTYDFTDYDVGSDFMGAARSEFEKVEEIIKGVVNAAEKDTLATLKAAFEAFADEGEWSFDIALKEDAIEINGLTWIPRVGAQHWPDEFPVRLSIQITDILELARAEVDVHDNAEGLRDFARKLRDAADEIDRLCDGRA